jgi:hypothetical protein
MELDEVTYDQVHVSGASNQINHMSVLGIFKHLKSFAKTKITHHIEGQVVAPICHVLRHTPLAFTRSLFHSQTSLSAECFAERADIAQDVPFHGFDCTIGESMRKHAAFASMAGFVDAAVSIERIFGWWEDGVELGLLDVGFVAVDCFQSRVAVD